MRSYPKVQALVLGAALATSVLFTPFTLAADRSARSAPSDRTGQARATTASSSRSTATALAHAAVRQVLQLRLFRFLHEDLFDSGSVQPGLSDDPDPTTSREDPPVLDKMPPKLKQKTNNVRLG